MVVGSSPELRSLLALLPGGFPGLGDDARGNPAAFLNIDPLLPGPGADGHGVDGAGAPAAAAAGSIARRTADLAGVGDVRCEGIAQGAAVIGVQVDFVVGAVEGEPDCSLGLAAVHVVDEQGLDLLGHYALLFRGGPCTIA